ncbi:MAG TPA: hypothetical protein VKX49_07250 [Bryobacteraceae bacterium]|nr:hypothetical protein [Bryobacteraceae bacterium]
MTQFTAFFDCEWPNQFAYFTEEFIPPQINANGTVLSWSNAITEVTSFSLQNSGVVFTGIGGFGTVTAFNFAPGAPFNSASVTDNAITVLHELGHIYEFLFGPGSTFLVNDSEAVQGSAAQSAAASAYNTKLVKANCFPGN